MTSFKNFVHTTTMWSFLVLIILQATKGDNHEKQSTVEMGFMSKIRSFFDEFENVLQDVAAGVQKLNRGIRGFGEFIDATIDEDCRHECPSGKVPIPKKGFIPSSNGCGSFGLEEYLKEGMLPLSEFVDCCNEHDLCYSVCGNDKDECDLKFKKCLYRKCRSKQGELSGLETKGCQLGAKLLYTGTTALGCKPYLTAQDEACECVRGVDEL